MLRTILCVLTSALMPAVAMAEDASPVARVELKDLSAAVEQPAERRAGPLSEVSVAVEAPRQQTLSDKGLQLEVIVRNNAAQTLVMEDPSDFIQIQLLNHQGYPVDLPPIPTGRFVCSESGGSKPSSQTDVRRPFELIRPEATKSAKPDKTSASVARVEEGRLTLPAGKEYRLTLRIRRILADPMGYLTALKDQARTPAGQQTKIAARPASISIPPDRYSVSAQIALISPTGSEGSRQLAAEPISVELKPARQANIK